jgi:surface antigen
MRRCLLLPAALLAAGMLAGSGNAIPDRTPIIFGYPFSSRCPGAGLADVVDRWHMYACNCTSYVAWALSANGQRTDWFFAGAMDAWNWPHVARLARLRIDDDPSLGAVAVWPQLAKPLGHVAYVTAVHDRRSIDVAEYNYSAFGRANTYTFDTRTGVSTTGAVFIHVPRRPRRPH